MMRAPRFLRRTELAGLDLVASGGVPVLERHERLAQLLAQRAGPAAAELFAEPVLSRGNDRAAGSISWYTSLAGEPVALAAVPAAERARAEAALRQSLAALEPLHADAELGPLLRAALVVPSLEDVLLLDGRPVLTGWGVAPAAALRDAAALADHQRATLGRYAALGAAAAGAAASAAAAPRPAAPPPPPPRAAVPPPPPPPVPPRARVAGPASAWNWALVPFAIVFAFAFLALGFWLAWSVLTERLAGQTVTATIIDERETRDLIDAQHRTNETLERQIADARAALARNVCTADTPQGVPAPPAAQPVTPQNLPQPAPGQQQFNGSLGQLLEQATVLVIGGARGGQGGGLGSGFFVAPGLIVTNRHVVEAFDPQKIFVTNKLLGGVRRAAIKAETPSSEFGEPDYAILTVENPPAVQPLGLTRVASRLDEVVAAGYPGSVIEADSQFRALAAGDASAIPEMVATNGLISAIQLLREGRPIIPNTASISAGNSGGPLVDRCGRVVGVNTFGRIDPQKAEKINYAQKADTLIDFLRASGVAASELQGPCQAAATQPALMMPGQAPPAAAPPPGPPAAAPAPAGGAGK